MKTADDIAAELSPEIEANNAAVGETNRRLGKIGDGEGNPRPDNPLNARDVFYRGTDENDRGVAILHPKCPILIDMIDGYYDTEVWIANAPGSTEVYILDIADSAGESTGGRTPIEGAINAAAFPSQDRLVIMRISPSDSGGMAVYVDVGPYQIAYEKPDGSTGYLSSTDVNIADPTDDIVFSPTDAALDTDEHRLIGIAFDPDSERFIAIPGAAQSTSETLPSADSRNEFTEDDYKAIDFTGYYPAGFVYTYFGQVAPDEDDCLKLYDPRLFMHKAGVAGPGLGTNAVRFTASANVTVASTASETTLIGSGAGSLALAANALSSVGRTIRIEAMGYVSDTGTPTLRLKFKLGSTVILDSTAVTLGSGISNKLWRFSGLITTQTAGASGKLFAQGQFTQNGSVTDMVSTAQISIDLTAALTADLTAQWSASSASNTVTLTNLVVEVLN